MKILQINNYNYLKGGSERVFQVTIELLNSHGHEVRFFSIANSKDERLCEGRSVEIQNWKDAKGLKGKVKGIRNFIYNKKVAKELNDFLQEFHPDVAHLHIFYGNLSNAVVDVLKKNRIPIVQSVHEFRLLCPNYTCLNSHLDICEKCASRIFCFSCIQHKCLKNSRLISTVAAFECFVRDCFYSYQKNIDAFIMVSRFIQNLHIKYYPQMASKSRQIYNSVDTDYYGKYVIPVDEKEKYYLYLGRLSYEKGIKTLIDVFELNPSLRLKIVGRGPIEDELKEEVNKKGLNNIEFLGFLSGERLLRTISTAYFTIVPSEWYENNPLSIIESLALGTPVIGSDIGGIPELIKVGYNGYLHKPKNISSLNEVLQRSSNLKAETYKTFLKHSIEFAKEKFDNHIYYNRLINLYEALIQQNKRYE